MAVKSGVVMLAVLYLVFFVFMGEIAGASESLRGCYAHLTHDYSIDSRHFFVADQQMPLVDAPLEARAKYALQHVLSAQGCQLVGNIHSQAQLQRFSCQEIVPQISWSKVCYGELPMGYVIISEDFLGNMNLIINRWD